MVSGASTNVVGQWQSVGSVAYGGVVNGNWTVYPNVVLDPGTYVITDSSHSTWSFTATDYFGYLGNDGSDWAPGLAFSQVQGVPMPETGPSIQAQPLSQSLPIGSRVIFAPVVRGALPLTYQWFFNGKVMMGATNAVLCFAPALTNSAGNYQMIITNMYGSATSAVATLTVWLQPNSYGISKIGGANPTVFLASTPGSTSRLWTSTNLTQWAVVATVILDSNGLAQFCDTNAARIQRQFYRLSSP